MYKLEEVGPFLEEWRPIKDYEGRYQISNYGRVKSLERKVSNGIKTTELANGVIIATDFDGSLKNVTDMSIQDIYTWLGY